MGDDPVISGLYPAQPSPACSQAADSRSVSLGGGRRKPESGCSVLLGTTMLGLRPEGNGLEGTWALEAQVVDVLSRLLGVLLPMRPSPEGTMFFI